MEYITPLKADDDGTIVQISNGKIRGRILRNFKNTEYYAFEGIPFAAPPVGDNRFKVPIEHQNWDGVLDTTSNNKMCIQMVAVAPIGSEDCLYLNVYTTVKPSLENNSLPVLVFIHGGAFQTGSAIDRKPDYFMDYGIILVCITYRLGSLGFLSTDDNVIPGNLGLKDQSFALRWVSKNIDKFGGDPNKVTISGQSAGSVSVSFQLLASQNEGLFRSAIMESGSSLCHHDFQPDPRKYAFELGKLINPSFNGTSQELLIMLKQLTADQLVRAAFALKIVNYSVRDPIQLALLTNIWLPVVENSGDDKALITTPMHQAFIDNKFLKVPMMAGFTSEEIVFFTDYLVTLLRANEIDNNPEYLIDDKLNVKDSLKAGEELKSVYTNSFAQDPGALIEYLSDNYYTTPILRQAELVFNSTPVYLYQFSYSYSGNLKPRIQESYNVGHTAELKFLYGNSEFYDKNDNTTHQRMMKLWTNFVKYQNPTPQEDDLLIYWPKTTANLDYYNINETLSVLQNPRHYRGWKTTLERYIEKPFNVY